MTYWNNPEFYNYLEEPFIPPEKAVDYYYSFAGDSKTGLVLGTTKSLYSIASDVLVVDDNQHRIDLLPANVKSLCKNWLDIDGKFDIIVGDGSLNHLRFPNEWHLFLNKNLLTPGGQMLFRIYEAPLRSGTDLHYIRAKAHAGGYPSFGCFKWDLAMYISNVMDGNARVSTVRDLFYDMFDKKKLAALTGWDMNVINTIDAYDGSDNVYSMPNAARIHDKFPSLKRLEPVKYPFSERCPFYAFANNQKI